MFLTNGFIFLPTLFFSEVLLLTDLLTILNIINIYRIYIFKFKQIYPLNYFIYKQLFKIFLGYMDCRICMEDEILVDLMVDLHCGHNLCTNCLEKLVLNQCPYCRTNIDNNKKQEDKTNYYLLIEFPLNNVDNTIQRKEKKKKKRKQKILHQIETGVNMIERVRNGRMKE